MKSFFSSLSVVCILLITQPLKADNLFQNGNTACESSHILCDSASEGSALSCTGLDAKSITCRNHFYDADFNSDTYSDCVVFRANEEHSIPHATMSLLLNTATPGASCGVSSGVLNDAFDYYVATTAAEPAALNGNIAIGKFAGTDTASSLWLSHNHSSVSGRIGFVAYPLLDLLHDGTTTLEIAFPWEANYFATGSRSVATATCSYSSDPTAISDIYVPIVYSNSMLVGTGNLLIKNLRSGAFDSIDTGFLVGNDAVVSIALADFNNDSKNDLVLSVNDPVSSGGYGSKVILCENHGNCSSGVVSFICDPIILDGSGIHSEDSQPSSIVTGDFNGDGNQDLAISEDFPTEAFNRGIHYFFGNGNYAFDPPSGIHINANLNTSLGGHNTELSTGCFDNDSIEDVVFSYKDNTNGGMLGVILSSFDPSNTYTGSITPLSLGSGSFLDVDSLDTADFDKTGGSDVIALATDPDGSRKSYLFMNKVEIISASAGISRTGVVGEAISISGASCSLTPADSNANLSISWRVTTSPAGAGTPSSSGTTTLTPTYTFSTPGVYSLELSCTASRCGRSLAGSTSSNIVISVSNAPVCGNSIQEGTEECDHGSSNGQAGNDCSIDCKSLSCGDHQLQPLLGETCDDGNRVNGDACDEHCQLECNHNGIREGREQCDDENVAAGDGCDANCRIECGNSIIDLGETCDDGNRTSGDGCDSSCKSEVCGDHIIDAHEDCDDGILNGTADHCPSNCISTTIVCGNHITETGEGCDHGVDNGTPGDTCSSDCRSITTNPVCGNRVVETTAAGTGETCDDGNTRDGDGCSSSCTLESGSLTPPPSLPSGLDSQGGCIASLNPEAPVSKSSLFILVGGMMTLIVLRKTFVKNK